MNRDGKPADNPQASDPLCAPRSRGTAQAATESQHAHHPAQKGRVDSAAVAFVNRALAESNYSADELFAAYRRMNARLRSA